MKFLVDVIKGMFVGIANIIPGVSGGTMAIAFGIYDKLLEAVANLLKDFKKSIKIVLPLAIGMIFGIGVFSFILPTCLEQEPFTTASAFTGMIIGGLPAIFITYKDAIKNDSKNNWIINILLFAIFVAIALYMTFASGSEDGSLIEVNALSMVKMLILGIIAAATMIIPGISGSLVLMILGYYFGVIESVHNLIAALKDMDMGAFGHEACILIPFGIGCLLGIFYIAKLIRWLLAKVPAATYSAILGLIITAPVSVYYKVNEEYSFGDLKLSTILLAAAVLIFGFLITIYVGSLDKKANAKEENTSSTDDDKTTIGRTKEY